MTKQIRTGYLSGGLLLAAGLFFTSGALQLDVGTARSMGPGFFPLCLGALLMVLSLLTVFSDWKDQFELGAPSRVSLFICAAVILFGVLIGPFGFIPSVALGVFVASIADEEWNWLASLVLAAATAVVLWVIFAKLLGLPIAGLKVMGTWIF
jgi:hypothetical protein